ncbi:unnamed protein product [Adineta steineri]|uniref:Uncharacterized protein n=1 Tax=Adineta steineri TaxID=433720 RepID=A0A814P9N6_9BILA|nr:unnamed protein product [Adineta steineri]
MGDYDEDDDYFRKRSPDYAKVQANKQTVTDHCAREHDKLKDQKRELLQKKVEASKTSANLMNESDILITELEQHAKVVGQLQNATTQISAEQSRIVETIIHEKKQSGYTSSTN